MLSSPKVIYFDFFSQYSTWNFSKHEEKLYQLPVLSNSQIDV